MAEIDSAHYKGYVMVERVNGIYAVNGRNANDAVKMGDLMLKPNDRQREFHKVVDRILGG